MIVRPPYEVRLRVCTCSWPKSPVINNSSNHDNNTNDTTTNNELNDNDDNNDNDNTCYRRIRAIWRVLL